MKDVPAERRGAKFVAASTSSCPPARHLTCRGECPGKVAFARLAGDYGFGYDPLFIPDECGVGKAEKRPIPRDAAMPNSPRTKRMPSATAVWRWQSWKKNYLNF